MKRVVLRYLQHRAREARAKQVQAARAEGYQVTAAKQRGYRALYINITLRQMARKNAQKASELRARQVMRRYFKRVQAYPRVKEIRKLQEEKVQRQYRIKTLRLTFFGLHQATQQALKKDADMRKALQFQVLRHNRYYLLMRGMRALQTWPRLKGDKHSARSSLVRAFRLKYMFKTFKTAVSDEAQQEAGLITEHMRNRYFTMWRHQL
jgi:hypothetical protein